MHAAVVRSFDRPPRYEEFPTPAPGAGLLLGDVLAVGLHPRVRSGADGSHYTSDGRLPLVPGLDGVARLPDGRRVYFVADDDTPGTMAEQAVVDLRRSVPLPDDADPVVVAAAMNPAMSSWIALRRRVEFRDGMGVLVLGATGNAGRLAVQIARLLGAGRVVGAGRDPERLALLEGLGASDAVPFDHIAEKAADVDVVLDYTWGEPTARAIPAVLTRRADRSAPLHWVQIGSTAGPDLTVPSAWLRSADLRILGSGQGSVTAAGIVAELPSLVDVITAGALDVAADAVPLADVEKTWTEPAGARRRIVFTPGLTE
ncbi:MAG: quinone oxidoreductase [Pseudonocardia sp. SCN 72-86]|nr:MAG: quinone oxidoreductase [Pseudonocardia sp. SCN 72-86]